MLNNKNEGAIKFTPFLKWAGGKRWLVHNHPHLLDVEFNRFIEPFLGSGAVYFSLEPKKAILCDKNIQLIETYQAIKDDWKKVENNLKRHHGRHNEEYYYSVRSSKPRSDAGKAARLIYLNRTCWNGLYRVNLKGEFNVPIGTKKNVILETDDFERMSMLLGNAELVSGDFQIAIDKAGTGDFIFVDPPYTVKHNNNGFVKYNEALFTWEDQIRLRDSVECAVNRGAKVLVTNAHHSSIKNLYKGVGDFMKMTRRSVISASSSARGKYEELIIKCY